MRFTSQNFLSGACFPAGIRTIPIYICMCVLSPVPFVMGSRYGRSSPARSLSPRNDRFFMGGRYGKRSEPPSPVGPPRGGGALFCRYTGVYPLYRCLPRIKQDHFDKRSSRSSGNKEKGTRLAACTTGTASSFNCISTNPGMQPRPPSKSLLKSFFNL
ncbi:hypothetical protein K1T71_014322 [Dendrolimus kikuchii]|uniref:Uncharacterized protein n=1 Tax=Dendrolimus kikuchii TaxID=765133 RepID=A0ACC1CFY8_9NEOP|nr:hypothetical protein K1T71_014322 [Dendrolimus kikuchii]